MFANRTAPLLAALLVLATTRLAYAGMPAAGLTEVAQVRLSVISFFLLGIVLSSVAIWILWNWLAVDFTWLPRLTFGKAGALVVLWGLLFVVVLTMISGARELMTPGAWRKAGLTYDLNSGGEEQPAQIDVAAVRGEQMRERRSKLERLSAAMQRYAATHDGNFPESLEDLPKREPWHVPGFPGTAYILRSVTSSSAPPQPLVHEPAVFDDDPLVLLTSGEIVQQPIQSLAAVKED